MRRILFAMLLLLHACASVPPPGPPAELPPVFALQGRVSVQYGEQALSGLLHWRAGQAGDDFLLSSPLGQGLFSISSDDRGVTLTRPGEPAVTAESMEALSQSALGFPLPLAGLRFWIQARPDPASASAIHRNAAGGVEQISQDGWQIDYLQYRENRPRKIHVTREGLEIRLVIDEWSSN